MTCRVKVVKRRINRGVCNHRTSLHATVRLSQANTAQTEEEDLRRESSKNKAWLTPSGLFRATSRDRPACVLKWSLMGGKGTPLCHTEVTLLSESCAFTHIRRQVILSRLCLSQAAFQSLQALQASKNPSQVQVLSPCPSSSSCPFWVKGAESCVSLEAG